MATYNVHGGHSLYCRGASKYLDEVNEDRAVKNKVIEYLRAAGHTVYDCTDDNGRTQNANLSNIVSKCNQHKVDLDISIHLNAGGGAGVEVLNYDSRTKAISDRICNNISAALGTRNRGTKYNNQLYVLRNTKSLAIIVECCFVDSITDRDHWNVDKCAKAIAEGVLETRVIDNSVVPSPPNGGGASSSTDNGQAIYQAYAAGKWWEYVTKGGIGTEAYAGIIGQALRALRAYVKGNAKDVGYLEYRLHRIGGGWYNWQRDREMDRSGENYAGDCKNQFDGLQMRIVGGTGKRVRYRVHCIGIGWLDWVTDWGSGASGYAGLWGKTIDAVQVEIV